MSETFHQISTRHYTKLVHEGNFVAQVDVELIYADEGNVAVMRININDIPGGAS